MALHPEILDRPAAEGARTVALALLAEARAQAGRLGDRDDPEALHDFRVAVRRLRSTLRAWRDVLGTAVRDKDLRRLRRVARATGEARDAEVLVAWLAGAARELPPAHRPAAEWLARRLQAEGAPDRIPAAVERFASAAEVLSRRLHREVRSPEAARFDQALARLVRDHAAAVATRLARVETPADAPVAHRARIAGKRLRYLLEPLRDTPGVSSRRAVRALKRLQDLLGDLNDARVAAEAVGAARREAGTERPGRAEPAAGRGLRPGLRALEAAASRRAAALFERLRVEVLPSRGADALAPALAVAAALEDRGAAPAQGRASGTRTRSAAGRIRHRAGRRPGCSPSTSRSTSAP